MCSLICSLILCTMAVATRPFIDGQTPQNERMRIFQNFVYNPMVNTIFISKVRYCMYVQVAQLDLFWPGDCFNRMFHFS